LADPGKESPEWDLRYRNMLGRLRYILKD
jgi:hypothetical protein